MRADMWWRGARGGGRRGDDVREAMNARKRRPYDDARAESVYMLNPISLSGVHP